MPRASQTSGIRPCHDLRGYWLAVFLLVSTQLTAAQLKFIQEKGQTWIRAENAPRDSTLNLYLVDPDTGGMGPAMFAKVHRDGDAWVLRPSFPLAHGNHYRAILHSGIGGEIASENLKVPAKLAPPPKLEAIYPTAQQLPANLLKFYLYFDRPMREGRDIFSQIHIEDNAGQRIHAPWRRLELWSADEKRLTLWIHPGRVKRGVNLREQLGPVLMPGREYDLVLDKTICSADGIPIGQEIRHSFRTLPEDYVRPLPDSWTLVVPASGTTDPLQVHSPEPLDHALVPKNLSVFCQGEKMEIQNTVAHPGESSWSVLPAKPWVRGIYELVAGQALEDLAGNTPERVFDTELTAPAPLPSRRKILFRVD